MRDTALKLKEDIPKSDVNKEYYIQNKEAEVRVRAAQQRRMFAMVSQAGRAGVSALHV